MWNNKYKQLEERTYGTMKIIVANGKIMTNIISKLQWYTTNDEVDVNKINKLIK